MKGGIIVDTVNDKLCRYEKQSLNNVVKDDVEDVNTLYKQFDKFMDEPFKHRRNADDVSISITGFTNQQRYESQLRDLIKQEAADTENRYLIFCKNTDKICLFSKECNSFILFWFITSEFWEIRLDNSVFEGLFIQFVFVLWGRVWLFKLRQLWCLLFGEGKERIDLTKWLWL